MRPFIFLLAITLLPGFILAQHRDSHSDSTDRHLNIQEVLILNKQGVSSTYQQEQRASKQMATDKILDHTPGVQMIRRGNYAWEPTIRSLSAGQINVTIDGMHIFGACTDRMDPVSSYIEPTNLKNLTVNIGPTGENYGGAIGGGLDFRLTEATPSADKKMAAMLGSGFETNGNGIQTLAAMHYSSPKFAFQGNAIFRKTNAYQAADRVEIPFSQFEKWNAALSTTYQFNPQHSLSADYLIDEGKDIGYPALTMDVAFAKAHITSMTHHFHDHHRLISHVKTKLYYNTIDHAMDDTKRPPEQIAMHMDMPGKSWTTGFYNELSIHSEKHHIQGRTSGYFNRLTADMTMYPDEGSPMYMYTIPDAQRVFAAFDLSHRWHWSEQWSLESNATWSYTHSSLYTQDGIDQLSGIISGNPDRSNFLWNIRTGTSWQPSAHWQFRAYIGHASRAASLQEYYGFYIYNRLDAYDYLGNQQLKSERSFQLDLGATYDRKWLRIETNAFRYGFSDYITGRIVPGYQEMTIGANGVKQYDNIPTAQLYGAEAAIRILFNPRLALHSANTFTIGEDHEGYALPMISPFRSLNSVHYSFWSINTQAEIEYNAAQNRISAERYGETSTPAFTLFHVGARRDFKLKNSNILTASLRVENIFDRYYYRHLDIMKIARPGRNFITQVTLSF